MVSQTELILLSKMNMFQLHAVVKGKSFQQAFQFKRDVQKALAEYSKHHKYDRVQEKTIVILRKIEKWLHTAYVEYKLGFNVAKMRKNKELIDAKRQEIQKVKADFEKLTIKESY